MGNENQYPKKYNNDLKKKNHQIKPFSYGHKRRFKKGYQNQMVSASRKTETHTNDKTVIVTESINLVDFNSDGFEFIFGDHKCYKKDS